MTAPVYIGDELSAAGWRLAGARLAVPAPGEETAALVAACAAAPLVLVSAAVAERIDAGALAAAALALAPLVLVVPDPQGAVAPADLAGRLRAQLGLEA